MIVLIINYICGIQQVQLSIVMVTKFDPYMYTGEEKFKSLRSVRNLHVNPTTVLLKINIRAITRMLWEAL